MGILAITRRQGDTTFEQIQTLQVPEAAEVWRLIKAGVIERINFDPEAPAVMLVLNCADKDAAWSVLRELPMVRAGFITFDLYALGPYTQLEVLFAPPA
ncbi:MAG: superoxide dismutase [Hyphomicrobiales bacterium]|nr:superoxide dismutase [Hyphomicrobiales bacterium]MCP5370288.1 superoxide dismutase [Hyphomicrobiales bacterium]